MRLAVGLQGLEKDLGESLILWSQFKLKHCYLRPKNEMYLENILKTRRFSELKGIRIPILEKDVLAIISKNTNLRNVETSWG
jgi:hypothetical protein